MRVGGCVKVVGGGTCFISSLAKAMEILGDVAHFRCRSANTTHTKQCRHIFHLRVLGLLFFVVGCGVPPLRRSAGVDRLLFFVVGCGVPPSAPKS